MANRTNHPKRDITGQVFGLLTVRREFMTLRFADSTHSELLILCDCACGKEHVVRKKNLMAGTTRSCGCFAAKVRRMRRAEKQGRRVEVTCE
jgi:hypothetical protein